MRDPRLTPARPDLAAASLKGEVAASRYAEGIVKECARGQAPVRKSPRADASLETELLYGERFAVYEEKSGWAWGQSAHDSYVGYVPANALRTPSLAPAHRVIALRSLVFPVPDVKTPPLAALPMNAKLSIEGTEGKFFRVPGLGFIASHHVAPIEERAADFVAIAEQFLGAPYLWGGKTAQGLDCSGLVQAALERSGIAAPRDTDMQERELGASISLDSTLSGLERGDLVFWQGHVGVMRDARTLLHANAHHMMVASEPLAEARERIAAAGVQESSVKRLA